MLAVNAISRYLGESYPEVAQAYTPGQTPEPGTHNQHPGVMQGSLAQSVPTTLSTLAPASPVPRGGVQTHHHQLSLLITATSHRAPGLSGWCGLEPPAGALGGVTSTGPGNGACLAGTHERTTRVPLERWVGCVVAYWDRAEGQTVECLPFLIVTATNSSTCPLSSLWECSALAMIRSAGLAQNFDQQASPWSAILASQVGCGRSTP
jgi:hypothetical protein